MKISKLFHTLYAFLMFLPVMVLPLFAININQKEVEPLTAQIQSGQVVDFNQLAYERSLTFESDNFGDDLPSSFPVTDNFTFNESHIYYFKLHLSVALTSNIRNTFYFDLNGWQFLGSISSNYQGNFFLDPQTDANLNNTDFYFFITSDITASGELGYWCAQPSEDVVVFDIQIFDLTQMFGSNYEPSKQQFDLWYPNDYYPYILSNHQMLYTGVDTLDNTDIGSQFLYSLYNLLKDYFNLPNYMNLGGLYDWFLVNLFSGYNSPVYFIIFDLMIYWLAMSLLWLIFDVLMYVPSMIHKMLDKARME